MLGTVLALAIALAQFTMSNGAPRTAATKCDALYYGLGNAPDLASAYECYGADDDFQMQIVMALNGDAIERDPAKIQTLFDQWARTDPYSARAYGQTLQQALVTLREGQPSTRIVFCSDIAFSTLDGMRCDSIRQFRLKADAKGRLDDVAVMLSAPQKSAFRQLRAAADSFIEAEGGRAFQLFIDGSIRHSASAIQEDYVREHFMSHVQQTIVDRAFVAGIDVSARPAIQKELDDLFAKDLSEREVAERDINGIGEGYRKATENARRTRMVYREAWRAMVMTLTFSDLGPSDAAQTMDTMLIRERIEELKNNILGIR